MRTPARTRPGRPGRGDGTAPAPLVRARTRLSARFRGDDRGVSMLEFAGFLPILLLVGMAAIQLGIVGYSASQAGSAARTTARVGAQDGPAQRAGSDSMSDWLESDISVQQNEETTTATVTVEVPSLFPFVGEDWSVTREATMPTDDGGDG